MKYIEIQSSAVITRANIARYQIYNIFNDICIHFHNALLRLVYINSLWASDVVWRQRSVLKLALVMACCLGWQSHNRTEANADVSFVMFSLICTKVQIMLTSRHGIHFRIIDPLQGEYTSHNFPHKRPEIYIFIVFSNIGAIKVLPK